MLIYVNITDRQTDGQTDRQTHQNYSSEPHKKIKEGLNLKRINWSIKISLLSITFGHSSLLLVTLLSFPFCKFKRTFIFLSKEINYQM
jgi:hypothetical protein